MSIMLNRREREVGSTGPPISVEAMPPQQQWQTPPLYSFDGAAELSGQGLPGCQVEDFPGASMSRIPQQLPRGFGTTGRLSKAPPLQKKPPKQKKVLSERQNLKNSSKKIQHLGFQENPIL